MSTAEACRAAHQAHLDAHPDRPARVEADGAVSGMLLQPIDPRAVAEVKRLMDTPAPVVMSAWSAGYAFDMTHEGAA